MPGVDEAAHKTLRAKRQHVYTSAVRGRAGGRGRGRGIARGGSGGSAPALVHRSGHVPAGFG